MLHWVPYTSAKQRRCTSMIERRQGGKRRQITCSLTASTGCAKTDASRCFRSCLSTVPTCAQMASTRRVRSSPTCWHKPWGIASMR